ncbi:MAG TPA: tetratricopeptide repeat protein [Thermoanaerobaculia bacterium]|nr:tetratricopeptide repeat protein [Thermoanaerobaculia bacterium]
MRRSLALSLIVLAVSATNAFAIGEARMTGKILDAETKKPIEGAVVTADAVEERKVHQAFNAKKDGSYTVFLLYGTIKYKFTITAPGYEPYVETMKLKLAETNARDFLLNKPGTGQAAPTSVTVEVKEKADPAVDAYNAGAQLANAGDLPGAIAKFEEAVAAKPELLAGWMALAKTAVKAKQYPKAIDAAKKVLDIDEDDADMWGVLYNAYTATGDKANAAIAEKKMPANAGTLFNDAARLINQGKDADAESLLKRAVEVDEKFAQAWYELGMVYARMGKNPDAKTALTKYLELDPNGKDAATAKEMLNYVK